MDFLKKAFTPAAMPEPVEKSRGGIRDTSELTSESVQRVCGEFLSGTFNPRVTVTYRSILFNTSCVNYFPDCRYFSVRVDETSLRLIVEPTTDDDKDGLKVAHFKDGKNVPRQCTAKHLCPVLFELMKWNPEAKYRLLPDFREFGKRSFMIFNLDEGQELLS